LPISERKIIRLGKAGAVVLPIDWVRMFNLVDKRVLVLYDSMIVVLPPEKLDRDFLLRQFSHLLDLADEYKPQGVLAQENALPILFDAKNLANERHYESSIYVEFNRRDVEVRGQYSVSTKDFWENIERSQGWVLVSSSESKVRKATLVR